MQEWSSEIDLILHNWMHNETKWRHYLKSAVRIKVSGCFSQSAIKKPRMPTRAWQHIYTKWLIISTLPPLISYYSNRLHLMGAEDIKVGFMTQKPRMESTESMFPGRKNWVHCCTPDGERRDKCVFDAQLICVQLLLALLNGKEDQPLREELRCTVTRSMVASLKG